jgi:hypothetical protein
VRVVGVAADVAKAEGCPSIIATAEREFGGTGSDETIMEAPDNKWQAY